VTKSNQNICRYFPDTYLLQGNVATHLRCGGIFDDYFITLLLLSPMVKNFWKSVNTWPGQ